MSIRTRIAPSPTGSVHIGNLRTSLYDYALAKANNGQFILRIEDTDRERYIEGAVDKVLDLHEYMGLKWDEGPRVGGPYAPYIQSERLGIFKKHALKLIEKRHAYYCFCTKEQLEVSKKKQRDSGIAATKYNKNCLELSEDQVKKMLADGAEYVIRLNVPPNEEVTWKDEVYGEITVSTNDLDDQILIKSDGFPTYHLAVVVDDHLMNVTHVMRGNDWIPSTPKHILLYRFFGWDLPLYIHLPNLREKEGNKKLSKRFGSVSVEEFLREGYLPEALLNFLMLLGWNPGTEKEIYSLEEFVVDFSIKGIQKTDLVCFDREKLLWFNGMYIRTLSDKALYNEIEKWAEKFDVDLVGKSFDRGYVEQVLSLVKERMKFLGEYNDLMAYFFEEPVVELDLLAKFAKEKSRAREILSNYLKVFEELPKNDWEMSTLDRLSHEKLEAFDYKPKEAFMTLRIAVTGKSATPSLFDVLALLGKEKCLKRLNSAIKLLPA